MAVWDGPGFQEGQTAPGTYLKNNLESTESYTLRAVRSIIFQVRRKKKKKPQTFKFSLSGSWCFYCCCSLNIRENMKDSNEQTN